VEVVEWLRQQQGIELDANAMAWAAGAGQIAMCKHLRSVGCEWHINACTEAIKYGECNTLSWLRENGCPWDVTQVCMKAARYGRTSILDYILGQGEVFSANLLTDALNCAAASCSLAAAQWLRQHGAEWPAVLSYDIEYDDVEPDVRQWSGAILTWARAEGCTSPTTL
jgi:hypothetical protein